MQAAPARAQSTHHDGRAVVYNERIDAADAEPLLVLIHDGVLLAARRDVLQERQVRFDERFDFHFYNQDFCRSARQAGLALSTWPIAITHQSSG